jgi:hypothetical protein
VRVVVVAQQPGICVSIISMSPSKNDRARGAGSAPVKVPTWQAERVHARVQHLVTSARWCATGRCTNSLTSGYLSPLGEDSVGVHRVELWPLAVVFTAGENSSQCNHCFIRICPRHWQCWHEICPEVTPCCTLCVCRETAGWERDQLVDQPNHAWCGTNY